MGEGTFYIDIHGCPKAVYDSEVLGGILTSAGYELVSAEDKRDITIIMTCAFLKEAREESDKSIKEAVNNPEKYGKVLVAGCYPQKFLNELQKSFKNVYAFTGVNDFKQILNIIEKGKTKVSSAPHDVNFFPSKMIITGRYWDYVKISEGCSHECSFCLIPQIRDEYRSRSFESIGWELELLEKSGIKEINIVSQDSSYYGLDKGEKRLVQLLDFIEEYYNFEWIRVLYLNPMHIDEKMIERIGQENVLPYFDIPFQHTSSKILKSMNRKGSKDEFLNIIKKIRKIHKDAFIRSTLMVGFPGETNDDFNSLMDFIDEAEIDHLGIFSYSDEKMSESYNLANKVKSKTAEIRKNRAYDKQNLIFNKRLKILKNKTFEALLEKISEDFILSRLWFQAPEGIDTKTVVRWGRLKGRIHPIFKAKIKGFDFDNAVFVADFAKN